MGTAACGVPLRENMSEIAAELRRNRTEILDRPPPSVEALE